MRTKNRLGRAVALTTMVGVMASVAGITPSVANADTLTGQTISVASGNAGTTFSLNLPSGSNACQGDTASGGYRWNTYIADMTVDLNELTVVAGSPVAPSGFVQPLYSTTGSPQMVRNTAVTTGQITGAATMNFNTNTIPAAGQYRIGFFCSLAGAETRHWITPITVTSYTNATTFNWVFGHAPSATGLAVTATGGNESISGVVTPVTATPAASYVVSATPVGGGTASTVNVPAAGPYTYEITGLVNGTTYDVVVTATNAAGSVTSSPPVQATPSLPPVPPAPVVSVASGPSPVRVSWTPSTGTPLAGATLVSHTVTFAPIGSAAAIAPVTVPAGTNLLDVTGVAGDAYNVSVVGNYSNGQVNPAGTGTFSFTNAQVVVQDITVVRPQGALVLTQRCGVHGSAPSYTNSLFGPTFPALDATTGADPVGTEPPAAVGTAPTADAAPNDPNSFGTGAVGSQTAGQPDGLFGQYPYPVDANQNSIATYPTNCAISLGNASLITSGPSAGAYFRATGRIAQLTVVDTRNIDSGWTLNGRMGDFFLNGNTASTDKFSGNFMGWVPEVTWDSNPNLDGYDTTAVAGNIRLPQPTSSTTGLGAAFNSTNTTLANSLAKANADAGLGMAVMDARLNLLIPVSADSGTYKGVLTFTIV